MLNEELTHVVLAQSYWHKNSWGFPKGKVNEDEAAHRCAGLFFSLFFLHCFLVFTYPLWPGKLSFIDTTRINLIFFFFL